MMRRFLELDLLRSAAVVMMIVYHLAYDLQSYYGWPLGLFENPAWTILERATAALFLLLVGCSFAISWNRHRERHEYARFWFRYRKYLLRGLIVIGCGMLVSIATYIAEPATYVRFGVLHLIGVSILLLPFFAGLREWTLLPGIVIFVIGWMLLHAGVTVPTSWLLPFGVMPQDFATVDYFPLLPWFGVVLIGYAAGYFFYVRRRKSSLSSVRCPLNSVLTYPGRHALLIYLIHQPVLLLLLKMFLG